MRTTAPFIALTLAATVAQATQLTFDFVNQGNGTLLPQDYGDRVTALSMGDFSYGSGGGFTPNVEVGYLSSFLSWDTGYSDLTNVVYSTTPDFSVLMSADGRYGVRLESLDIGNFSDGSSLTEIRVEDGDGNVLFSQANVTTPDSTAPHLTFSFPANLTARQLKLTILGANANMGFDNLRFSQVALSGPANGTVLTFDSLPGYFVATPEGYVPDAYGDRVVNQLSGNWLYDNLVSFTPNVTVDYVVITESPPDTGVYYWGGPGYSDLVNALWSASSVFGVTLTADPGYSVELNGFDLGSFYLDPTVLSEVRVEDGNGRILFSNTNVPFLGNSGPHVDIDFSPTLVAPQLRIIVDTTGLAVGWIAIDTIHFGQVLTADLTMSRPSPTSDQVTLSWPNVIGGLILEWNPTTPQAPWTPITSPAPTLTSNTWSVTLTNALSRSFYRLHQP